MYITGSENVHFAGMFRSVQPRIFTGGTVRGTAVLNLGTKNKQTITTLKND